MDTKEINDGILYRLECIAGFSMTIQTAMEKGMDLSEHFEEIDKVDRLFADLSDMAELYKITGENYDD